MSTDNIDWSNPFEIPNTNNFDVYARLVKDGQPVTDAIHSPVGQPVSLQMGVRAKTPPPTSGWPEFAWDLDGYNSTVEVNDNLASALRAMGPGINLIVLHERCVPQLAEIAETDPGLLSSHDFTARPDEFHRHTLSFNSGKQFNGPGFQGFRVTNPGGIGLRFTGTGYLYLRCNEIVKCGQGIAVTDETADMDIYSEYNRYDEFIEFGSGHPQAVYLNRGEFHSTEDVITQVGHLRGDPRPSGAQFNHAFYIQNGGELFVRNTFIADMDSHGVNCRGDCDINGIMVLRAANAIGIGHDKNLPPVEGVIRRAVIANTEDLDNKKTGIGIAAEKADVVVHKSLIADEHSAGQGSAFRLYDRGRIELSSNVRVQGMPRAFDATGTDTYANGNLNVAGTTNLVNRRPSSTGHSGTVTQSSTTPLTLPNFDDMDPPKPGHVGTWIDSILNA